MESRDMTADFLKEEARMKVGGRFADMSDKAIRKRLNTAMMIGMAIQAWDMMDGRQNKQVF